MAEDEILKKHVKTAYKAWRDPEKDWKHKLKDILLEVVIIVFAVSVSIWLHNWSEDMKDKKTEKEFLTGLKEDIQADQKEMKSDRAFLQLGLHGMFYFEQVSSGLPLNKDSLNKYMPVFFSQTQINPRISRFEALKGSGKLDIIDNKKLLYNITDLYQKIFPQIFRDNQYNNSIISDKLAVYMADNLELNQKGQAVNAEKILRTSKIRIMMTQAGALQGSIDAYTAALEKGNEILKEIDEELK